MKVLCFSILWNSEPLSSGSLPARLYSELNLGELENSVIYSGNWLNSISVVSRGHAKSPLHRWGFILALILASVITASYIWRWPIRSPIYGSGFYVIGSIVDTPRDRGGADSTIYVDNSILYGMLWMGCVLDQSELPRFNEFLRNLSPNNWQLRTWIIMCCSCAEIERYRLITWTMQI